MSWVIEEITTSSIGFIIAMVVLGAIIGVGLYGYWVYVNHQTLENYLWPVAEVVPLRNGTYYLGIVNTGNEPIIVEDIYTNNSKVLSVDAKPLSHNQWLTETLSSLPVAVRVCSALDPKVCEVVPVHGWGYARLLGNGVWVDVVGSACYLDYWKVLWYNGNGGQIEESTDLSWFVPTNQTLNFIAKAYGGPVCSTYSTSTTNGNTTTVCTWQTCYYPTISGPSSVEPNQNATFTLGCGSTTTFLGCQTFNNGGNNNGNNTNQPPVNSTNGPPNNGNKTNNPPPPQYYCTVYPSASDTVNGASDPTVSPPSATLKPGASKTFTFSTDTSQVTEGNTTYAFEYWDINGNKYNTNPAQYTFTCPSNLSGNETYYINGVAVFQAQSSGGSGGGNGGTCNPNPNPAPICPGPPIITQ